MLPKIGVRSENNYGVPKFEACYVFNTQGGPSYAKGVGLMLINGA